MLMLIVILPTVSVKFAYFNTSHVNVNPVVIKISEITN